MISVTHLAQLAYYADKHFLLEKATRRRTDVSAMRELSYEERVDELVRLQAGGRVSEAVLDHVREVLGEIHAQRPARSSTDADENISCVMVANK